jgi:hypothetical protein
MFRIVICGDRNYTHIPSIESLISQLPKDATIIHGACVGADIIAGNLAVKYGLTVLAYPADWNKYGRAAGPIRNKQMIRWGGSISQY